MATDVRERARRLRNGVEPLAARVSFAPEAHAACAELGFDGSPAIVVSSVALRWQIASRDAPLAARERGATAAGRVSGQHVGAGLTTDTASDLLGSPR